MRALSWPAPAAPELATAKVLQEADEQEKQARLKEVTRRGYWFWGPVAAAILLTEALGAASSKLNEWFGVDIAWPTISWTVGQLEDRWAGVGAVVVGLIACVVFYAVSKEDDSQGRTPPPDPGRTTAIRFYGLWLSVLPAALAGFVLWLTTEDKFFAGCVLYGTFAFFGVVLPSVLLRGNREVRFPTVMFTVRQLRMARPWTAAILVASMAILLVHLALYPWPDITREPAHYAGLSANDARKKARREVAKTRFGKPALALTAQIRGISGGHEAWVLFFAPSKASGQPFAGCVVTLTDETLSLAPECAS
jgi:hypothetical protein